MSVAQEREAISERNTKALNELKRRGIGSAALLWFGSQQTGTPPAANS